jgi:hypothetical protein
MWEQDPGSEYFQRIKRTAFFIRWYFPKKKTQKKIIRETGLAVTALAETSSSAGLLLARGLPER